MRFCIAICALLAFTPSLQGQEIDEQVPPAEQPASEPMEQPAPAPSVSPRDPRDEMDGAVDLGLGLFEFIHIDFSWIISRKWTVGLELGMLPVDWILRKAMGVDDLSGEIDVAGFAMTGEVETRLGSGAIFGRLFPWKKTFFLEGSIGIWRLETTATGTLDHDELPEQLEVKVNVKVWVPMVGLHAGWRILFKKGPFIDIGLGANVMLSPGAEVTFGGATVEEIREYDQAAMLLDMAQDGLSKALEEGVDRVSQKRNKIFPTAYLRFGWAFDLW